MGNCSNCRDTIESHYTNNNEEFFTQEKLPKSFIHGVDEGDANKEIMINVFQFLKDLDNGKDKPGEIHIPPESKEYINYLRTLPLVLSNRFKSLEEKFGFFDKNDTSTLNRKDNFRVERAGPIEIVVIQKKQREEVMSLHPAKQDLLSAINIEFNHQTLNEIPSQINNRRDRREITVKDLSIPLASELHEYYEGEWRKLKYHGFGKLVTVEGHCYEGYFAQGLPWGSGRILFNNGVFFKGRFEKGKYHGDGEIFGDGGQVLKGNFVNGLLEGKGNRYFIYF